MIFAPTIDDVAETLEQMRQSGYVRPPVKAKGTEEDDAELRAWYCEIQRKSRAKKKAAA